MDVVLNGGDADRKLVCDLLVGETVADQLQHLPFALRQCFVELLRSLLRLVMKEGT